MARNPKKMPKDIADALAKARDLAGDEAGTEHQTFEFEGKIKVTVKIDRDELLAEWFRRQGGTDGSDPTVTVKNLAYEALMASAIESNLNLLLGATADEIEWGSSQITWDVDLD